MKAIQKVFNATVSENYLEIHLFWAGKGTCCTPKQGDYGPMISALHVVPGNVYDSCRSLSIRWYNLLIYCQLLPLIN
jgi:hypothetical protein